MDRQGLDGVTAAASPTNAELRAWIGSLSLPDLADCHRRLRACEERAKLRVALRPSDGDASALLDATVRWSRYVATVHKRRLREGIEDALRRGAATGFFDPSDPDFQDAVTSAQALGKRPYRDSLRRDFRRVRLEVRTMRRTLSTCAQTPRRGARTRGNRRLVTSRHRRTNSRAGPSSPSGGDEPPPELGLALVAADSAAAASGEAVDSEEEPR